MSMRRFSVVEGDDAHGVIVGEGVEFAGAGGHGRAVVMPSDPSLGYPTFYAGVEHVTVERPDHRVVWIDAPDSAVETASVLPGRGTPDPLADLAAAPHREPGADVEP